MNSLFLQITEIGEASIQKIESSSSLTDLDQIRVSVLGKKGSLSEVLKGLGSVSAEERPKVGAEANKWKAKLEVLLEAKKDKLETAVLTQKLSSDKIDISLPSRRVFRGSLHPITQTTRKIIQILSRIGFDLAIGPEIETEYLNFEAVNIPKDHPARDMQDTFFMGPGVVLRTHTSAVQMRAMRAKKWPIRVLCPGAVYRCDDDATHSPMFHQVEGLWVDKKVTMADLKGTLLFFARELFGSTTQIRLRPSYFPFVEPGAEVDLSCFRCGVAPKDDCKICRGSGWLEVLGAGMVHPKLFEMAGYDPNDVTGFAFGFGVERMAMLLHEIADLRTMFQGDVRFITQF